MDLNLKKEKILKLVFIVLLPLCALFLFCLLNRVFPSSFFLPNSTEGNDQVIYFEEIASVVKYNRLIGYFGNNDSLGIRESYYCWSPILNVGYVLWGKIFGWNYYSPFVFNVAILVAAMFGYALIVDPSWKEVVVVSVAWILSLWIVQLQLSMLVECEVYALIIVWTSLFRYCAKNNELSLKWKLAWWINVLISVVLTLMRPYYLLFFVALFIERIKDLKRLILIIAVGSCSFSGYFYIIKYYCAQHFGGALIQLPKWDYNNLLTVIDYWINRICLDVYEGVTDILYDAIMGLWGDSNKVFHIATTFIVWFFIVAIILLFYNNRCEIIDRKMIMSYVFINVGMVVASTIFFRGVVAEKHFLEICLLGIFILPDIIAKKMNSNALKCVLLISVFIFCVGNFRMSHKMFSQRYFGSKAQFFVQKKKIEEVVKLNENERWDNTVTFAYNLADYRLLYLFPDGMGVQVNQDIYCIEHYDELHSKYLVTGREELIEKCDENGAVELLDFDGTKIFAIR